MVTKKKNIPESVRFYVQALFNGTRIDVTDLEGNVLIWKTVSSVGFKNSKKNTPLAASVLAYEIVKEAIERGAKTAIIESIGLGVGRNAAIKTLCDNKITITCLMEKICIPHNGVRPKKKRRM